MSGFSTKCSTGVWPLPSFLIFWSLCVAGRQSATAAVATKMLAACAARVVASSISCADSTSMRLTPRGVGRCTGPATSVTSAPASRAARAMAKPILPDEWLVMPRIGSSASKVGPAVTSTFCPASSLGWKKAVMSSSSCAGSSMRPSPVSPQACQPLPTPSTVAPSADTCIRLRCVAGWAHISRFMAGAINSGTRSVGRARHSRLSSSSERPCTSRAMKSALQGASTIASASRLRLMCGMLFGSRASHCEV
ncbi:hypothetical protein D9M68_596410 [compost metagenome]